MNCIDKGDKIEAIVPNKSRLESIEGEIEEIYGINHFRDEFDKIKPIIEDGDEELILFTVLERRSIFKIKINEEKFRFLPIFFISKITIND